jgi:AcrR family transcriptional regulator
VVHSSQAAPRPPGSARERRRTEAISRIVEAASELVRDGGFERLTMPRLARELGYTVGALYRYFPSKDALVVAVLAGVLDALHSDLLEVETRVDAHLVRTRGLESEDAALLRILGALANYEALADRRPEQFRLLSLWLGDPREVATTSVGALITPSLLAPTRHIRSLFDAATAAGALSAGDSGRRAAIAWAALHGVMQIRRFARLGIPDFRPDPMSPTLLQGLLIGWGADARRVAAMWSRAARLARPPSRSA